MRKYEVVLEFGRRPHRNLKESREISLTRPPTPLGDIRRDRRARTADLARESVAFLLRECRGLPVGFQSQGMGLDPNLEISEILQIAERTVNFHVANTMRKLGVYSRTHAVAKSISLGLTRL